MPNASQVCSWISWTERARRLELWIEAGEDLARRARRSPGGRSASRRRRRGSARPRARGCSSSTRSAISSSAAGSTSPTSSWRDPLAQDRQAGGARRAGVTSHTRPASKRSRSRSSSASRSRGRRSEVSTSCAPAWCSALKVWKNSCSVLALLCEELDVVDEQDVDAAVGGLERLHAAAVQRADEVVGERLDGRVAGGQAVAVLVDVVGDRVQQVGLAEAGRAADEERVVGQAGHLGDRERGGVGEPVAVADHELVERQARVELLRGRRAAAPRGAGAAAPRAPRGPTISHARARTDARSRRRRSAGGRSGSRPSARTSSGASRTSVVPAELAEADPLEPDVPGGLGDGASALPSGSGARLWLDRALTRARGRASSAGPRLGVGLEERAANGPEREHSKGSGGRSHGLSGASANRVRM